MSKPQPRDYRLLQTAIMAMDLLQQVVGGRRKARGRPPNWPTHQWWTAGVVPASKIEAFAEKMHQQHHVLLNPKSKSAARAAGASTSYLIMRPRMDRTWRAGEVVSERWVWDYVLLSTVRREPQMENGHRESTPVQWMNRFELRLDRLGWTWHLTQDEYERLNRALLEVVREAKRQRNDLAAARLKALLGDVLALPRYRGVRQQVISLLTQARGIVRSEIPRLGIYLPNLEEVERVSKRRRVPIYETREGYPKILGEWVYAWRADLLISTGRFTGGLAENAEW